MASVSPKTSERTVLRASEVCELAGVQPYVLRTWETEFANLGISRAPGGPRFYRQQDVERVLQIKQLLFVEGLTLAGARRRLDHGPEATSAELSLEELLGEDARRRLADVKSGLRWILDLLSAEATVRPQTSADEPPPFVLTVDEPTKPISGSAAKDERSAVAANKPGRSGARRRARA